MICCRSCQLYYFYYWICWQLLINRRPMWSKPRLYMSHWNETQNFIIYQHLKNNFFCGSYVINKLLQCCISYGLHTKRLCYSLASSPMIVIITLIIIMILPLHQTLDEMQDLILMETGQISSSKEFYLSQSN